MQQERTRVTKINTLAELLSPAWYKYDKNLPSVIKMMGYKTVLAYEKENNHIANYYRVLELLKSKPQEGVAGVYTAVNDLLESEEFKTHLWIEDNIAKYKMVKDGNSDINNIVRKISQYLENIKLNPSILSAEMNYTKEAKDTANTISGDRFNYFIDLKIIYDPMITYIPKIGTPYNIYIAKPFYQTIKIKVPRIDINVIKRGDINEIMKHIITSKTLRDNFKFDGPCLYTTSRQSASGCLGTRSSEFNEITRERNLAHYINFISDWGRTYTAGLSGPHRTPSSLISGYKVLGWIDPNTPEKRAEPVYCKIYNYLNTSYRNAEILNSDIKDRTQYKTYQEVCAACVAAKCRFNAIKKEPDDATIKQVQKIIVNEIKYLKKRMIQGADYYTIDLIKMYIPSNMMHLTKNDFDILRIRDFDEPNSSSLCVNSINIQKSPPVQLLNDIYKEFNLISYREDIIKQIKGALNES